MTRQPDDRVQRESQCDHEQIGDEHRSHQDSTSHWYGCSSPGCGWQPAAATRHPAFVSSRKTVSPLRRRTCAEVTQTVLLSALAPESLSESTALSHEDSSCCSRACRVLFSSCAHAAAPSFEATAA